MKFKEYTSFSDDFGKTLSKGFSVAIKRNQWLVVENLIAYLKVSLSESFMENKAVFTKLVMLPSEIYSQSQQYSGRLNISELLGSALSHVVLHKCERSLDQAKSQAEIREINYYGYELCREFSQLFFEILRNKDLKSFHRVYQLFVSCLAPNPMIGLPYNPNINFRNPVDLENHADEIKTYLELYDGHRRINLALFSWIVFLHEKDVLSSYEAKKLLAILRFKKCKATDLMRDLEFYNTYTSENFDLDKWDHRFEENSKPGPPPDFEEWIAFGVLLFITNYADQIAPMETADHKKYKDSIGLLRKPLEKVEQPSNKLLELFGNPETGKLEHLKDAKYVRSFLGIV
jgi:hypothetical protein